MLIHQPVLDQLAAGAHVITPNNRLSQHLLTTYMQQQTERCISKPACMPYTTFIQQLYQKARHRYPEHPHPRLISEASCRLIWQQVLSPANPTACNQGLLEAVMNAWTRCVESLLSPLHPEFTHKPESLQFQQYFLAFQHALHQHHAITAVQLVSYLLDKQFLPNTEKQLWVCFDDYTPLQRALQAGFQRLNVPLEHYELTNLPAEARCIRAESIADEYQHCLHWLKNKLAAGEQRIGVIVPDLTAEATRIQRLFKRHFSPTQFNLSFGRPLADYTLVAHALQWLQLDLTQVTGHQIRLLLSSPFLAYAHQEASARQQLLQDCAALNTPLLAFEALLHYLTPTCSQLHARLAPLKALPAIAPTHTWANHFKRHLESLGFPGDGSLSSTSYQCLQRFNSLFDEWSAFSGLMAEMTRETALACLQQLANSTVFQPKQTASAPIHVLGLLEASGCQFDSLWVLHLTDQALPQKTQLSAFIPINLQRSLNMPHANPAREYQFARQTLNRLQQGAHEVCFSYAQLQDDTPYLPSPLIQHLAIDNPTVLALPHVSQLLSLHENYLHPVTCHETITGGSRLLANQAKCPFRAFAAHRLHAKAPPDSTEALTLAERGQLLHKSLELLWQDLHDQATLLRHDLSTLRQKITDCIQHALTTLHQPTRLSFPPLLQQLEIQRITRLIQASLAVERLRPPFRVQALEHAAQIELNGLVLQLKLDRLDEIGARKKWVIDYKSRTPDRKPWLEERPEEPQLLLYALLDTDISGLLFMELAQGQASYLGLSDEDCFVHGVNPLKTEEHWSEKQAYWRQQLQALADEFRQGICTPTPTRTSTCARCEFQNLCRIDQ